MRWLISTAISYDEFMFVFDDKGNWEIRFLKP
jgi:hypothetical protein